MSQHTPGPWSYANVEDSWNTVSARNGAQAIAKVFGASSGGGEANARLIAKAPDMRKELDPSWFDTLAERIAEYLADPSDPHALASFMEDAMQRAMRQRALLREIEGNP